MVPTASPPRVPVPALVTATVWAAGSVVLSVSWNATAAGERPMSGSGAMVNVTATVCGEFPATGEVTGTVAVYVPGASAPLATVSVSVAGAVAGLTVAVSHPDPLP